MLFSTDIILTRVRVTHFAIFFARCSSKFYRVRFVCDLLKTIPTEEYCSN